MHRDFLLPFPPFPQQLYLAGFMGSGKSTLALNIAPRLGYTSVDLDKLTGALSSRSVASLWAEGEGVFRAAEKATLLRVFEKTRLVVATGGGALLAPEMMEGARRTGFVVYLRLAPEALFERLEGDASRPLLQGPDGPLRGEALRARIAALLAERTPHYEQAHLTMDVDGLTVSEAAMALLERVDAATAA